MIMLRLSFGGVIQGALTMVEKHLQRLL